ncbi:MAG: hypothetical protein DDT19_01096 [Syntrophomonadaceae bacterium]|nr:hypothetical protein [Bacillota bacterium]
MNELIITDKNLPAKMEDLARFVLVGREKLIAVRAAIRAIDKLDLAMEVREQKKEEAQALAGALLDAEARLGEMLKEIPKTIWGDRRSEEFQRCSAAPLKKSKGKLIKELGFEKTQALRFETLADNKEIVEQVKAEALENDKLATREEVLKRVRETKREEEILKKTIGLELVEPPRGKYNIILADPPWKYNFSETRVRAIENQYPTMDLEDIKNLMIPAANDAVLFLWATAPKLEEALQVLNAWGFTYKTCAVWDKEKIGMGYWFRGQHELLLVGVKGNHSVPRPENRHSSVIRSPRSEHSKKPVEVYEIIERMFPGEKYIELFARNQRPGWGCWGLEAERF